MGIEKVHVSSQVRGARGSVGATTEFFERVEIAVRIGRAGGRGVIASSLGDAVMVWESVQDNGEREKGKWGLHRRFAVIARGLWRRMGDSASCFELRIVVHTVPRIAEKFSMVLGLDSAGIKG